MFKDYHIIIIPSKKEKTRTFKVSGFTLKVLLMTLILSVPLFFVSVLSAIHYQNKLITLKRSNFENHQLIENRNELIARLTNVEKTIATMDDSIGHLGDLMDVDPQSLSFGTGPLADLDVSLLDNFHIPSADDGAIDSWLETHGQLTVDKFSRRLNKYGAEAALLNKKLEEIFTQNKDKIRFVNSSPNILPVQGWITSEFGMRRHPLGRGFRMHGGIDIASPKGTVVRSPAMGNVLFAGRSSGYGNMLVVDHGYGVVTMYAHLSKIYVKKGMKLKRGDTVGEVGLSGAATGPHLHYEVQVDGIPTNPLAFVVQ